MSNMSHVSSVPGAVTTPSPARSRSISIKLERFFIPQGSASIGAPYFDLLPLGYFQLYSCPMTGRPVSIDCGLVPLRAVSRLEICLVAKGGDEIIRILVNPRH